MLYSRTFLFIHSIHKSLHLLTITSHPFSPNPMPTNGLFSMSMICFHFLYRFVCVIFYIPHISDITWYLSFSLGEHSLNKILKAQIIKERWIILTMLKLRTSAHQMTSQREKANHKLRNMFTICITELSWSTYKEFFWLNKERLRSLPKKWAKIHEQAFARKKTTRTPKHMKICLVSFVNEYWYNGAIRKDHFTFTTLDKLRS